ncbi:MAG: acylphosphatase, partial [Desulfovibrio sp.]|nr:acylphosphatase [Desulfovibrio sp.]
MGDSRRQGSQGLKEFVIRKRAVAEGRVQGVGFRPFVWRLARELELTGHTRNTSAGVVIEIEGKPENLDEFERRLTANPPPLARITSYKSELIKTRGDQSFVIKKSDSQPGRKILVSPDIRICSACLADIRDPANPRFGYPFANCTDCGPRYTITASLPYDRATTTMACFPLCDRCEAEYENPADRRFHAQPVACPDCGPKIWYADVSGSNADRDPGDALKRACELILNGGVLALKGLGGFQLVCDARSEEAVARLREAKNRPAKPFAVMTATTDDARLFCDIDENEA